jgi:membrane-associated phospholipid phosphatase
MVETMNTGLSAQVKTVLSNYTLPVFMTVQNKNRAGFFLAIVATVLYLGSNHFHYFPPRVLPFWWIDEVVPFVPMSVWIYISEYLFFPVVYFTCKDLVNLNKYFYSFLFLQTLSVLIFIIWPTAYPRDLFPLTHQMDSATYFVFNLLRTADTAANCCPSLHVSSVYLSAFIFLDDQKRRFPFFFVWGSLIAASTMTTKQHYMVDVIAGFLMALATYWIFHRYISYRAEKVH